MTRINLVPVKELTDQHLLAEYRELPRIHSIVRKLLSQIEPEEIKKRVPDLFTLGTGHVRFFYDKGEFQFRRYKALCEELYGRGFNANPRVSADDIYHFYCGFSQASLLLDYVPTPEAMLISRARLEEKIAMKPSWYRYYGKPLV